jgi:glycolate oxidase
MSKTMRSAKGATSLVTALQNVLGQEAVLLDADSLEFFAHDVYARGQTAICIVRPDSVAAVQDAVRACAGAGVAMIPRGGGASYTDGYISDREHVLFDLSLLDFIEIDLANNIVRVGAGTTWAALKAALDPLKLRTPFWGPFSGIAASIGGSVSQNSLSHGSGRHGITAQSVLGLEVVLADGTLMRTVPTTATRFFGPDMTGLFTGDCGALGIKVSITMPLLAAAETFDSASFAFTDFTSFHRALATAQREGLEDEHFSFDLALSQGQIARQEDISAKIDIARNVMRTAPNFFAGLLQLGKMALAGGREMKVAQYTLHFIVEGVDNAEVKAKLARLREIMVPHGYEIANSAAAFVKSMPFAPLFNLLGPKGERWVPLHGLFNHEATDHFHAAFQNFLAAEKAEMERHGLWVGTMFSGLGSHGVLYEVAIYWPDAVTAYHRRILGENYLASIPSWPASPENRAYADGFKRKLIALMSDYGATHYQIGRVYPYLDRIDPAARALISEIKRQLDPHNLMNPGALGLGAQ